MIRKAALLAFVCLSSQVFAQAVNTPLATSKLFSAQGLGFSFQYSSTFFLPSCQIEQEPKLTIEEVGKQIPYDVGPARAKFILTAKTPSFIHGKSSPIPRDAWVQIIPLQDSSVPDFKKAYPELDTCAKEIKLILRTRKINAVVYKDLPNWNIIDCAQTIHAKAKIIETPFCEGIQYLTTLIQEPCEVDNERLLFMFVGLSRDGHYLLNTCFSLAHPRLPIAAPGIESAPDSQMKAAYTKAESLLNQFGESTFFPTIDSLADLIQSIRPIP